MQCYRGSTGLKAPGKSSSSDGQSLPVGLCAYVYGYGSSQIDLRNAAKINDQVRNVEASRSLDMVHTRTRFPARFANTGGGLAIQMGHMGKDGIGQDRPGQGG